MARVDAPSNPFVANSLSADSSKAWRISDLARRARTLIGAWPVPCITWSLSLLSTDNRDRREVVGMSASAVPDQDRNHASVQLLPLSKETYQAPTDRDMLPSERRLFVQTHRTCVFGYGRRVDGPVMSIVYYVPDDNGDLLVATMAERAKAKAVARNGKVSLCVLDETWPFAYLQVYCDAVIDDDEETLIDVMMAVAERMSGEPVPAELRPAVKAVAEQEGRVLVRCRPYATFVTPPRHLHSNEQQELTHWVSGSMPWDAADTAAK